ncbi:TonB-dependent receptor [Marixanthomonas spongiae]|uniref:TonB-dependent receptor n=1 Tax=Marixanthomonas spongiae TaxID=2174845 RepID=A0A2U0HZF7_9FLAO|nr:TonB-dependent receptor [Marixanthomonas spongiae]PVW14255.1 TonB-dependent receptor [Marixanthomonas spongiae]
MKKFFTLLAIALTTLVSAQNTGSIVGKLTDKDYNNEPLPFANVLIKNSEKGTTSDFDGLYELKNVVPGTYTLVYSFVGYETVEINDVTVEGNKVTTINVPLGASAAALDEVVIKTTIRRESEVALLLEQKKAVEIKESIGAEQMSKMGVSDVSSATTKISGVNKTDGTGDVFVRGLGDRYLYTTLNGLPIPSDDIERKNINLELFPTRLIQSVSVSKTTSPRISADQASGNIDITSKELSGSSEYAVSASSSVNTNVVSDGVFNNFKVSPNNNDVTAGFYSKDFNTKDALTQQTWSPEKVDVPINRSYSFTAGSKIGDRIRVLFTAGQSSDFEYRNGVFRQYRSNFIDDTIPDAITWKKEIATSGLLSVRFRANDNNDIKFNTLVINKIEDQVFEGGRAGTATIFEETDPSEGLFQFIRDQNLKKTLLSVTQLTGDHNLSENNTLTWGAGYNFLSADEPNRIRNEVNFNDNLVQLGRNGGFQQRKSIQKIEDVEYNGRLNDVFKIIDEESNLLHINVGGNFRKKTRDFGSQFFGVEEAFTNAINPESIDQISEIFTQENFTNGLLKVNELQPDLYEGTLQSIAGYFDFVGTTGKFTIQGGLRFQKDDIDVDFDVNNFPGRTSSTNKDYRRLYPSFNLKYAINEKQSIRFANSYTTTLPEFKEIAPFEYVSPVGQVTRGNPDIEASNNYNYDLKWEFFPSRDELLSVTGFYKKIEDPINKVQDRGSAGVFSYFNSGNEAEVYGLEVEGRVLVIDGDENPNLKLSVNASRMWHKQDLKEVFDENGTFIRTFRYKGLTETDLQGASDWIVNGSLNFDTNTENPFEATLTGNYASDRIYALGAPEIQTSSDINYNDAIVENGFVTLDLIINKEFGEHWRVGLSGKNLLNPEIKRTQLVRPSTTGIESEKTVLSYTRGVQLGLNLKYIF